VWRTYLGGKNLDILEGKKDPQDTNFPENWIASTTRAVNKGREDIKDEGVSEITIDGVNYRLKDIFDKYPVETIGVEHHKKYGANTQFLLKFLDSAIRLHVQCHPTIHFAKKYLNSNSGKTEAYVILKTREEVKNPYIYLGFQKSPGKKELRDAIIRQDVPGILSYFEKVYIKPGDVFIVPGGFPHAIGEGVFMIEIMEPTDFAVRVEFERGGCVLPEQARFMGRDVDFALSMFNYEKISIEDVKRKFFLKSELLQKFSNSSFEYNLIDEKATKCFKVKKLIVKGKVEKSENSFFIGIVSSGKGKISSGNLTYNLKFGDNFFIPSKTQGVIFESGEGMEVITFFPPVSQVSLPR
jgi:mannose-6-phosphate isomerase